MATPNFNLTTYSNGEIANFLTAMGWNKAMNEIDSALESVKEETTSIKNLAGVTYVGICNQGETSTSVSVPGISENDKVVIISDKSAKPTAINITPETGVEVTWNASDTDESAISFNLTVYSAITEGGAE